MELARHLQEAESQQSPSFGIILPDNDAQKELHQVGESIKKGFSNLKTFVKKRIDSITLNNEKPRNEYSVPTHNFGSFRGDEEVNATSHPRRIQND